MSYAEIASKGPKQTPEEAAAPQPPQISVDDVPSVSDLAGSSSTSSLVDVDTPSVRTVPSDFAEQDIKTDTQAARVEREQQQAEHDRFVRESADRARAEADLAKKKAKSKARKADSWLVKQFEGLSDGASGALVAANFVAVLGLSGFLGFKAWGLYERGRLDWSAVGLGLGVLSAVGVVESVFASYLNKAKGKKSQ
ncbi:hypothetical protein B0T22DRAFT_161971 [Podospora appendiculata]|uniref:Mitochondrial outer membrane protein OM14 C-terminal domain-containing protein n=1 Tax=Podospora appendiculata TaxID=314037 RepID=A0AAE0XA30_9PEZI|nr:hypothetical protein B0T22DRAFT_161971 [Podospora appendiculata]